MITKKLRRITKIFTKNEVISVLFLSNHFRAALYSLLHILCLLITAWRCEIFLSKVRKCKTNKMTKKANPLEDFREIFSHLHWNLKKWMKNSSSYFKKIFLFSSDGLKPLTKFTFFKPFSTSLFLLECNRFMLYKQFFFLPFSHITTISL